MNYISKLAKRIVMARWALLLIPALASCTATEAVGPEQIAPPDVADVSVLPESSSVQVGRSLRLTAQPRDNQGHSVQGQPITWTSSDPTLATVDSTGLVQLIGTGTVNVYASSHGKNGRAKIVVTPIPVAIVTVTPTPVAVQVGQQATLGATTLSSTDSVLSGRTVTWSSSNAAVASVNANGVVAGVSAGSAMISATSEGVVGVASVSVSAPAPVVTTVTVAPSSATILTGATQAFTATVRDQNNNIMTGQTIAWTSTSTTVATVSAAGVATGVGAGTSTIRATVAGITGSAALTVNAPAAVVTTVTVAPGTATVLTGATQAFTATVRDQNNNVMSGQTIAWTSTSTAVATVSAAGVATGVSAGTSTIRATVAGITGSAALNVNAPAAVVTTVTVAPSTATILTGATQAFTATVRDQNNNVMSGQTIAWTSTSTAVATVSAAGVATGVSAGTATIRATVAGITGSAALTVNTPPPPTVATVTLSPSGTAITTGGSMAFTATARDAGGNAITGLAVTWSSTNTAVATVSAAGVASGVSVGTATIRATISGITGSATLTVSAPATGSGFVNEPAGFVALGEWKNASALNAAGWYADGNPSGWGAKSRVTSGYAGTPSVGGSAVYQTYYAGGVEGGHDAGRMQFDLPANTNEIFFAAEVQFKGDYPTSTSSGGNKQFFVTFTGGGRYFVNLDDGLAAGRWGIYQQSSPLLDSSIPVVYGSWIKVEWYLKRNTGAGDGIMRLWINGVLAINLTNLTFPTGSMAMAYDDGSNNGNHLVEGDVRAIRQVHGAAQDAYRFTSVLRVSVPQP